MALDPNSIPPQVLAQVVAALSGGQGLRNPVEDPEDVVKALLSGAGGGGSMPSALAQRTKAITESMPDLAAAVPPGPERPPAAPPAEGGAPPTKVAQAGGVAPMVPGGPAMSPDAQTAVRALAGGHGGAGQVSPTAPIINFIARMTAMGVPMQEIMMMVQQRQALMPQYDYSDPFGREVITSPGRPREYTGRTFGAGKEDDLQIGDLKFKTYTTMGPGGKPVTRAPQLEISGSGGPGGGAPGTPGHDEGVPRFPTSGRLEDIKHWQDMMTVRRDAAKKSEEGLAEARILPIKESITKGDTANKSIQFLNMMSEIDKLPDTDQMNSGPHAHLFLKAKQIYKDLTGTDVGGVTSAEALDKLNGFLASTAARELTSRPTQFDFKTFLERNPGIELSRPGRGFLVDMLRQSYKQDLAVAKAAQSHKDPTTWYDRLEEITAKHPITASYKGQELSSEDIIPEFQRPDKKGKGPPPPMIYDPEKGFSPYQQK